MSRRLRIVLAAVALLLTVGGALVGRSGAAQTLGWGFHALAALRAPTPRDLGDVVLDSMSREMIGELLLGFGLVLWTLVAASVSRASLALTAAAVLMTLGAGAVAVSFPSSRLAAMLYLREPSHTWPQGVVKKDKTGWNVFVVRTPKNEWGVSVERGSPVGPEGLVNALRKRFGPDGKGKRPIHFYVDLSCPDDIQKVFFDAAHAVADPARVTVDDEALPPREDFPALIEKRREEQLDPYRDTLEFGILARVLGAAALAAVVWWMPRNARGAAIVTGGNLVLAFGQAVGLPVALYVAAYPDYTGSPDFKRVALHVNPHVWMAYASAAALALGSLLAMVGQVVTREEPPPPRPTKSSPPEEAPAASPSAPS